MAVLLTSVPESLADRVLPHKTWTRDEVAILESTGLFAGTHYELIDGELIDKMGKGITHVKGTRSSVRSLEELFGAEYVLHEAPIDVAPEDNWRNEPEPDVIALRRPYTALLGNPAPAEIALAVEVANTSISQDLETKARLYARARIADYWVLDVKNRRLHVFRDPSADSYATHLDLGEGESVAPLEKPDRPVAVAALLR